MAAGFYEMRCADGTARRFVRGQQGRRPSGDPKENVPLRLHRSMRAKIAETGMSEQEFIENAVRDALIPVIQELLK